MRAKKPPAKLIVIPNPVSDTCGLLCRLDDNQHAFQLTQSRVQIDDRISEFLVARHIRNTVNRQDLLEVERHLLAASFVNRNDVGHYAASFPCQTCKLCVNDSGPTSCPLCGSSSLGYLSR